MGLWDSSTGSYSIGDFECLAGGGGEEEEEEEEGEEEGRGDGTCDKTGSTVPKTHLVRA